MKLIMMRSDVNLAGPARMILGLVAALNAHGIKSTLFSGGGALESNIESFCEKTITVPELRLENRSLINTIKAALILRREIKDSDDIVIHTHNAHCALVALIVKFFCLGKRFKIINTVHGEGKEHIVKFLPIRFIAVSDYLKRHLIKHGISEERISVIHNSLIPASDIITENRLLNKLDLIKNDSKIKVVNIGMFTGHKGQDLLLRKLFMNPRKDDFEIHFVGDGVGLNHCIDYVCEKKLGENVIFHGKSDKVSDVIDTCHLMIHMSTQETFGLVLAESMARGVPCIVNDVGGVSEVVKNAVTGFTCNEFDDVFLIAENLFRDSNQYREFALKSIERTKDLFASDNIVINYMREYNV